MQLPTYLEVLFIPGLLSDHCYHNNCSHACACTAAVVFYLTACTQLWDSIFCLCYTLPIKLFYTVFFMFNILLTTIKSLHGHMLMHLSPDSWTHNNIYYQGSLLVPKLLACSIFPQASMHGPVERCYSALKSYTIYYDSVWFG